jgi:hypothetical protein
VGLGEASGFDQCCHIHGPCPELINQLPARRLAQQTKNWQCSSSNRGDGMELE